MKVTTLDPVAGCARACRRTAALFVATAAIMSSIPALIVRIPPMLDYPNHYVRLWLIAGGAKIAPVSSMWALDWSRASINIAIDLVALVLGQVTPVTVIGPVVLTMAIVFPPLGVALLGAQLFGRLTWWHVLCFVLAWNWVFLAGFLNFEISLGLALLGAALDVRLHAASYAWLVALRIVVGACVLVAHPFGYLFYVTLLAAITIGPSFDTLRFIRNTIVRSLQTCLPALAPLIAVVFLASALPGSDDPSHFAPVWQQPTIKAHVSMMLTGLKTYRFTVDACFGFILFLPVVVSAFARRLRVHAGLLVAGCLLTVIALLMPSEVFGTAGIDTRLPCMVVLTFAAAVLPDIQFGWGRPAAAFTLAAAVVALRVIWIGDIWLARQADFASLDRALSYVPAGAAILPMENLPASSMVASEPIGRYLGVSTPNFWAHPTVAIMDRHAFVPNLFSAAGKQPVRLLSPWDKIGVREGPLAPVNELGNPDTPAGAYLGRWQCFDFILVVNADIPNGAGPLPASPLITLVADEGFARLLRIRHDGPRPGCQ